MKTIITSIAIIATLALTSCGTQQLTAEQLSWQAFCLANGYALNDDSDETVNKYLDTWCGSAAEEEVLINAGIIEL